MKMNSAEVREDAAKSVETNLHIYIDGLSEIARYKKLGGYKGPDTPDEGSLKNITSYFHQKAEEFHGIEDYINLQREKERATLTAIVNLTRKGLINEENKGVILEKLGGIISSSISHEMETLYQETISNQKKSQEQTSGISEATESEKIRLNVEDQINLMRDKLKNARSEMSLEYRIIEIDKVVGEILAFGNKQLPLFVNMSPDSKLAVAPALKELKKIHDDAKEEVNILRTKLELAA